MTRHGKNSTASSFYSYHEKRKDTGAIASYSSKLLSLWIADGISSMRCDVLVCFTVFRLCRLYTKVVQRFT